MKDKGQIILGLILIMAVALAIGVAVIQKSLFDVSTATKVEQSQRAFSAAEAGIEKALKGDDTSAGITLDNQSSAVVEATELIPYTAPLGTRQDPLEYPQLAKEEIAQIWLAQPTAALPTCSAADVCYKQTTLDIFWGSSSTDKAALELTLIYHDGLNFQSRKWFLDQNDRAGFCQVSTCSGGYGPSSAYQCRFTLGDTSAVCLNPATINNSALPASGQMLLRARLLYNTSSQPLAVHAVGTCGKDCSIPPHARIVASTGTSGQTQRTLQVIQIDNVVHPYLDFAIFSAGEIKK